MGKRRNTLEEPRLFEEPKDPLWDASKTEKSESANQYYAPGLEEDEEKKKGRRPCPSGPCGACEWTGYLDNDK